MYLVDEQLEMKPCIACNKPKPATRPPPEDKQGRYLILNYYLNIIEETQKAGNASATVVRCMGGRDQ